MHLIAIIRAVAKEKKIEEVQEGEGDEQEEGDVHAGEALGILPLSSSVEEVRGIITFISFHFFQSCTLCYFIF